MSGSGCWTYKTSGKVKDNEQKLTTHETLPYLSNYFAYRGISLEDPTFKPILRHHVLALVTHKRWLK